MPRHICFSANVVSAEEHWETGAIQVQLSQRNAFQEGKKQTSDEQQVNHLLLSDCLKKIQTGMTGLVSMRVTAAGTRVQPPLMATGFTQTVRGSCM